MSTEVNTALKGIHHATLAWGCRNTFRAGGAGSPVLAVVERKARASPLTFHVGGLPVDDRREALRPSTRPRPTEEEGYEEEG